jgi:transcriptional regulator with XRE-family HTH domain
MRAFRRLTDLSQRELGERIGASAYVIARMELRPDLARAQMFAKVAVAAGMRLQVTTSAGEPFEPALPPQDIACLRDQGGRLYPAHLDVRPASHGWWGDGWPMFFGHAPQHTFDRNRFARDWRREHEP